MLAIKASSSSRKTIPNILPCSIKHNGPVNAESRYWSPSKEDDGTSTAYFRGRKLRGRNIKVPEGYQGVVLEKTDRSLPQDGATIADRLRRMEEEQDDEDMEVDLEKPTEVKMMDPKAKFDGIVVWGHEMVPEDDDVYLKGVQEWIAFAEAVRAPTHGHCLLIADVKADTFVRWVYNAERIMNALLLPQFESRIK